MTYKLARMTPSALALGLLVALSACGDDTAGPDGGDATTTTTTDATSTSTTPSDTTSQPDVPIGDNHPPELARVGDRVATVDKPVLIVLDAKDADNDALTFSVFGQLPPGARFDKAARRFEWTPTVAGETVFLTFVVSDGQAFDRETVRIEVTAGGEAHPPAFVQVGDQRLDVGQPYELQLEATDPDGDPLTFGSSGALPAGATLDPATGLFAWQPAAATGDAAVRVTFTVTDGALTAQMAVRFVVGDAGGPQPPVFAAIPARTVKAGEPVSLTLQATDPNGDSVTYAIVSGAPAGATLDGASLIWTPTEADAGRSYEITFSATDGTFTALATAKLNVVTSQTTTCTPDPEEPNDTIADAEPLTPGTVTRRICETDAATDFDVFAITVPAGQQLTATLTFDAADDLDLFLLTGAGSALVSSEGFTGTETITFAPASAGTFYLTVAAYGVDFGLPPISTEYTLTTALSGAQTCQDDALEPNDSRATARPFPAETATLQICRDDRDFWSFTAQCGALVEVGLDIQTAGRDLDMYLYEGSATQPIASATTEDAFEILEVPSARAGQYTLEVQGWQGAEGAYQLLLSQTGSCADDALANASAAAATALTGEVGERANLVVCCGRDWFRYTLAADETLAVDVTPSSGGSVGLTAFAPDGTTQLQAVAPRPGGASIEITATTAGTYYVAVSGSVGARYTLTHLLQTGGCTLGSCQPYEVCDQSSGACVSDICFAAGECPSAYECVDTFCAEDCFADDDCRPGYACKALRDGFYCIVEGAGGPGAACQFHDGCSEGRACLFDERGGYCAEAGCGGIVTCDTATTKCATVSGLSFCAKRCAANADCRASEGYFCSPEGTCLPPTQ